MTVNLKRSIIDLKLFVIDESQAEKRPVSVQEAEIRWEKVSLVGCNMFDVLSCRSKDSPQSPLSVLVR